MLFGMFNQSVCTPKLTLTYTISHNHISICPWPNFLGAPHIYSQISMYRSPKLLWLTSFYIPYLFDVRARNIYAHHVCPLHIPWRVLYIHIPLCSCCLWLARTLGSHGTSKLMGCGLPFGTFGLLCLGVHPGIDPKVYAGVPPPNHIHCHMMVFVVYFLHWPSLPSNLTFISSKSIQY